MLALLPALLFMLSGCIQGIQSTMTRNSADDVYFGQGDKSVAFKQYLEAASAGDKIAQYRLAFMYFQGDGVKRSNADGVRWMEMSARNGYAQAQHLTGLYYFYGRRGVKRDAQKGLDWVRQAADQGDVDAMVSMGVFYASDYGVRKDPAEAARWFGMAKAKGYDVPDDALNPQAIAKAKPGRSSAPAKTSSAGDRELLTRIQAGLAKLGLYTSKVDGLYGKGTQRAITAFQKKYSLPVDGKPSPELLQAIEGQTASTSN